MNSLFGIDLPTPVNFVIAFVVVLLLIGAATWLVRRVSNGRSDAAARGRLPRLAVVDAAAVDGRRKLVIIRRDNVEHLLMIGGPSDVVVETNIIRAAAAVNRDAPAAARNGSAEAAPRAMPLPDPTPWPLQPEPAPVPAPTVRAQRSVADEAWRALETPTSAAPEVRPVRAVDTLAGLAEELARPMTDAQPPRPAPAAQPPRPAAPPVAAPQPAAAAATTNVPLSGPGADQTLAEMAQRLEAALRRPNAQKVVAEGRNVTATVEIKAAREAASPSSGPQPKGNPPPPVAPKAPSPSSLEKEMASLLTSRQGKT